MEHLPYIYLAGKIAKNDWRTNLVKMPFAQVDASTESFPVLMMDGVDAVSTGPFYNTFGHGVAHGDGSHGIMEFTNHGETESHDRVLTVKRCLTAIGQSDFVYFWLNERTCFGSLVEVGYARAQAIPIYVGMPFGFEADDFWFALAISWAAIPSSSPVDGLRTAINRHRIYLNQMPYQDYLRTSEWQRRRTMAINAADARCQLCNSTNRLHVHHRTYERRGCELPTDLTVLCADCHGKFHNKIPTPLPTTDLRNRIRGIAN